MRGTPYGAALAALVLAGFYVLLATWMRRRPRARHHFEATLAIATVFLTLVIPFALDERSTAGAWTLEGAGLVWIGFRQRRGLPRVFGYLLLVLAGLAMLIGHQRHGAPAVVFNAYLFNGLMAAAASLAAALFVDRAAPRRPARRRRGRVRAAADRLSATLWFVTTATIEIDAFVPTRFVLAAVLVAASAVALLYAVLARRLDWPAIAWPALAHAPIASLLALVDRGAARQPVRRRRLVGVAARLRCARARPALRRAVLAAAGRARRCTRSASITLALVGALLGRAVTARWGDAASAWPWLGWLVAPAALLLLLPRPRDRAALAGARAARGVSHQRRRGPRRRSLAVDAGRQRRIRRIGGAAAARAAAQPARHRRRHRARRDAALAEAAPAGSRPGRWRWLPAAGFVWLNAMLVRGFHHYGGVPYHVDAWLDSLAVQTGITLLWTAIALVAMWLAARARRARCPGSPARPCSRRSWSSCSLVDLSGSGTVTRIVSFIGVGVLMLVIGYVAPLPAQGDRAMPRCDAARRHPARARRRAIAAFAWMLAAHAAARPSRRRTAIARRSSSTRRRRSCSWPCRRRRTATSSRTTCATCASSTRAASACRSPSCRRARRCTPASRCARRPCIRCRRGRRRGGVWPSPVDVVVEGDRISVRRRGSRPDRGRAGARVGRLADRQRRDARRAIRCREACACAGRARPSSRPRYRIETSDDLRQWRRRRQRPADGAAIAERRADAAGRRPAGAAPGRFVRLRLGRAGRRAGRSPARRVIVAAQQRVAVDSARELTFAPSADPAAERTRPMPRPRARCTSTSAARCRWSTSTCASPPAPHVAPVRLQGRDARRSAVARARRRRLLPARARRRRRHARRRSPCRPTVRFLRVVPDERAAALDAAPVRLVVHASLASLVFATQGEPPFRLLAGSRDAPAGALPLAPLVPQLDERACALRPRDARRLRRSTRLPRTRPSRPSGWRGCGRGCSGRVLLVGVAGLGALVWRLARARPGGAAARRLGAERQRAQAPRNSPTGFSSSTRSQTVFTTIRIGVPRIRPTAPHSQPNASTPTKTANGLMRLARPVHHGVSRLPTMAWIANELAPIEQCLVRCCRTG